MPPLSQIRRGGSGVASQQHSTHRRRILKNAIVGITKPAIRRLARRGGVKRISGVIYDEIRNVIKQRLRNIITELVEVTNLCNRKIIRTLDVVFILRRLGTPVYGFDDAHKLIKRRY